MERHRSSEGTVIETLEAAKSLMADISASAEKRADILLKNAELDAQLMQKEARDMADKISEESEAMKARFISFRDKYKRLWSRSFRDSNRSAARYCLNWGWMILMILPATGSAGSPPASERHICL